MSDYLFVVVREGVEIRSKNLGYAALIYHVGVLEPGRFVSSILSKVNTFAIIAQRIMLT